MNIGPTKLPTGVATDEMRAGVYYIVTRASEAGEFEIGDRIRLLDDGCIENQAAAGWIEAKDVSSATAGMKVRIEEEHASSGRSLRRAVSDG